MAGWTCPDNQTIEWDGTVKAKKNLEANGNLKVFGELDSSTFPAFSVHKDDVDQLNLGTAPELVTWSTALFNKGDCFNLTTGRFTAPVAGIYIFSCRIVWLNFGVNDSLIHHLYKNGELLHSSGMRPPSVNSQGPNSTWVVEASAGDYFEIFAADTTITTADINGLITSTWWMGSRIG